MLIAQGSCNCENVDHINENPEKVVAYLESSDLSFTESVDSKKVEGIQEASYYYCKDGHGFLLIKFDKKERLYKEVPLEVWFELKFNDTMDHYYKSQIKYVFIPV